ncbi:MAG: ABC transporter ATP-binding protein [Methanobacteriota archaeon]
MAMVEIKGLTKRYKTVEALRGLDMTLEKGEVYGFCGPNGAGKTTTLKILVGLVGPTGGTASMMGLDVVKDGVEARKNTGYLPELYGLPGWDTPRTFLTYMGVLSGIPEDGLGAIIEKKAEELGFPQNLDRKIKTLSKGNKQKVGIAQALLHDPAILLLDEPTTGLDPIGRNEVLGAVKTLANAGKTVLFSTHILSDVDKICDRVGIVYEGRMMEEGAPAELKGKHQVGDLDAVFLKVAKHG